MNGKAHRDTIFLETAEIIAHQDFDGSQYLLRLHAPDCARAARAGQFAHLQCDPMLAMRRPLSIMRAHPQQQWVEFLYKAVGQGTSLLSHRNVGDSSSLLGPIGQPFRPDPARPRALLLGGGVGGRDDPNIHWDGFFPSHTLQLPADSWMSISRPG